MLSDVWSILYIFCFVNENEELGGGGGGEGGVRFFNELLYGSVYMKCELNNNIFSAVLQETKKLQTLILSMNK